MELHASEFTGHFVTIGRMPNQDDVARVALALPDAAQADAEFEFRVNGTLFVWAWRERVDPRKAKVPSREVVVVRVRDEMDKQTLLDSGDPALFTEPHFDGYANVLVRLHEVDPALLEKLITDSYFLAVAKRPPRPRAGRSTPRN
jgi:hypothetical protein